MVSLPVASSGLVPFRMPALSSFAASAGPLPPSFLPPCPRAILCRVAPVVSHIFVEDLWWGEDGVGIAHCPLLSTV